MAFDFWYALRLLRRAPAFTAAAVVTLALGIGANVAVFTFVDAIIFKPLPFPDPDRLVSLYESHQETGQDRAPVLPGSFLDWRERSGSFEAMSLMSRSTMIVTNRDEPARVSSSTVSPAFFELLGIQPALGRTFPSQEAAIAGHEREIVISHRLWQRWFGGERDVLGQTIEVQGGVALTVVGVMPATFDFPQGADVWHSLVWDPAEGRGDRFRQAIARLKPGVSLAAADGELRRISEQLAAEFPQTNRGWFASVEPLATTFVGAVRPPLALMLAAVGLVFLIACVNVATLVLQQGLGRRRELAMRAALGASRLRLVRQSVVEHGVLACLGSIAGGLIALFLIDALIALAPPAVPRLDTVAADLRMLAYLLVVAVATTVIIAVLPALRASRPDATAVLRSGAGGSIGGRAGRGLVVAELALTVVLVVGAGLMVRTMLHLQRVDLGFEPAGVDSTELVLPLNRMMDGPLRVGSRPAWDRLALFYGNIVEQAQTLPGVDAAAVVAMPALSGRNAAWLVRTGIVPPRSDGSPEWRAVQRRTVTPRYFEVLRLPLSRGRSFTNDDQALEYLRTSKGTKRRGAAIVNHLAAQRLWPGEDAIGKTLTLDGDWSVAGRIVVGVSADARDLAPDLTPEPIVYVPFAESPNFSATLLVRRSSLDAPAAGLRARLRSTEASLLIGEVRPLAESYRAALAPRRFIAVVLSAFAATGLLVAGVGLYGVMALSVVRRTRELGIRIALGATWNRLMRQIFKEAAVVVVAGTAIGGAAAAAATKLLRNQLVGIGTLDVPTWGMMVLVLATAGLAAAWLPARRAARVDPIEALRHE